MIVSFAKKIRSVGIVRSRTKAMELVGQENYCLPISKRIRKFLILGPRFTAAFFMSSNNITYNLCCKDVHEMF
jgi:hypothetical protein